MGRYITSYIHQHVIMVTIVSSHALWVVYYFEHVMQLITTATGTATWCIVHVAVYVNGSIVVDDERLAYNDDTN